jgi:hypothetical protein
MATPPRRSRSTAPPRPRRGARRREVSDRLGPADLVNVLHRRRNRGISHRGHRYVLHGEPSKVCRLRIHVANQSCCPVREDIDELQFLRRELGSCGTSGPHRERLGGDFFVVENVRTRQLLPPGGGKDSAGRERLQQARRERPAMRRLRWLKTRWRLDLAELQRIGFDPRIRGIRGKSSHGHGGAARVDLAAHWAQRRQRGPRPAGRSAVAMRKGDAHDRPKFALPPVTAAPKSEHD